MENKSKKNQEKQNKKGKKEVNASIASAGVAMMPYMSDEEIDLLCSVIKTHMGPWTTDYKGEEVLEAPKTKYQNFVHMCDYLASRKFLLVPFDDKNVISV